MDKKFKKTFFLICLAGGVVFAVPFFFVFGSQIGYPWYWAIICLFFGFLFAIAFYFAWLLLEKFQKPFSFENPKAQKKLLEYEELQSISYEFKISAYMSYGKGLKQAVCETIIYFETELLRIVFCYFKKVYSFDIPYDFIDSAIIENNKFFVLHTLQIGHLLFSVKESVSQLKKMLIEKGIYIEEINECYKED